ncbi:MAG TPA: MFS transporter [Victivallales bacterium]|nr:MFS transporter [Victivallales bacterium]
MGLKSKKTKLRKDVWFWVPSTFFMEGLIGTVILYMAAIMYKNLGLSNTQITVITGMLLLPYGLRPLWAAFVDLFMTKRWWIYFMEILIAACCVALIFALQTPFFITATIAIFWAYAFIGTSHDMACDGNYIVQLVPHEQSLYLGVQGASYQVGKILVQGVLIMIAGYLFEEIGNYHTVWAIVIGIAGAIILTVAIYHRFVLPKNEKLRNVRTLKSAYQEFLRVFIEFIKIKRLWIGILFLLLYKLGETLANKIMPLFLLSSAHTGGLGLTDQFTGFSYGVVAPIALLLAGLLGGYAIYKKGLKFWLWWMVIIMNLPHLLYVILAMYQPTNHLFILSCITIEQFCFAFGYSAYAFYLMYLVRDSRFKTAHYAFFSGIMMLALMGPGMISGWLETLLGYEHFFWLVLAMVIPTIIVVAFLKIDKSFGIRKANS